MDYLVEHLVHSIKVHCPQSISLLLLTLLNGVQTIIAPAHWSLPLLTFHRLINPLALRAVNAKESAAAFTVISDIFEIKF